MTESIKIYAIYNRSDNKLLEYCQEKPKDDSYIELSEDVWQQALEIDANFVSDGRLVYLEPEVDIDERNAVNLQLRQIAYETESDPLFMEWQFDQTDHAKLLWRNKVIEIKTRLPLTK